MSIHSQVQEQREIIDAAQKKIEALQHQCSHPIEARTSNSYRSNSEWDDHAYYETCHKCDLCGFYWIEECN
jgi:hypothetical protein